MPVFQLELRFDDKGAVVGAKSLNELATAADRTQKSFKGFEGSGRSLSSLGNNASDAASKMKGLAVQILALVGAYKALQGAQSFLGRNFSFSSNIEDSKISIASVIGATNKIADAQGKVLAGSEKFRASQEISADLMSQIQVLALSTTATFDDLVDGVSGIIAPATKAGIAIEKLPKFAITAAQAMAAMKVPVQQMRTEIEALLSGNINKTQDILATNLGITGDMVKNWQAQGVLVEELEKRLRIFAEAGDAVAQTWSGLRGNMEDALDYLSAQTGEGLFEHAKQSYRELLELMVNTDDNKLGLNEDIGNIVSAVRELQDEIGNELLSVTRDFIDYLKELNKPENIAELKREFKDVANTVEGLWGHIKNIGTAISGIVSTSLEGWRQMPDIIKELGIVGAIAFGAKGRAALVALGASYSWLQSLFDLAASGDGGADAYKKYWAEKNGTSAVTPPPVPLARSSVTMGFVGPPAPAKEAYTLTGDIGGLGGDKDNGASKIASTREQLQKIREEIAALNGEATKSSNSLEQKERQIEKLGKAAGLSASEISQMQADYASAFQSNTLRDFNKELAQVSGNTAALRDIEIGDKVREWEQRFRAAGMTAEEYTPKITAYKKALQNQSEVKDLQTAVQFYKELGELSGQYGQGIEIQNRLLKEQARAWKQAGIPDELVAEMVKLKQLQDSVNGFDGAYRGLLRFTAEYSNEAKQWESITYSWATGFNDTTKDMWGDFLDTGKVSFDQISLSFTKLLKDMSYQAFVQPIVLSIVGMAQNALYDNTSMAGASGGGAGGGGLMNAGMSMAQQYGMSELMGGTGLFSGVASGINGFGASLFPSVFAPSGAAAASNAVLMGTATPAQVLANIQAGGSGQALLAGSGSLGTTTLTSVLGAAGMGFGLGSLGGNLLAGIVGGNSANMGLGGGLGGGLGAGIGSIIAPGLGTWIGGALGSLLGGSIGSIFGGGGDDPGLWAAATIDLSKRYSGQQMEDMYRDRKHKWSWYTHADDAGYLIQSRHRDGMPKSAAEQATAYLEQVAQQGLEWSDTIATAMDGIGKELSDSYKNALAGDALVFVGKDWEGKKPDIEGLGNKLFAAMKGKISGALSRMDISSLSIAADGMLADTTDEIMTSISKSMQFFNVGESLGDYSGEFTQAVSGKVLDMLNSMDTSGMRLDIDKSSLAGWGVASQAVAAWNEVDAALESILRPTSELDAALGAAKTQFDGWLDSLKALGWQQEALAEIEKERLIYMQQYSSALTRSAEQNLYLRGLALSAGTDSWTYQQQALKYQQENELADYAKKYGSEAGLLAAKAAQLNKDEYKGKTDWDNNAVYAAIKDAGMTVVEWLERYGRSEGFTQNIGMYDQLVYTQQAESIQAEIDYLQTQYNSMLQEQISSAQILVNSFDRVVDSLDKARRNLWSSDANISTSRLADARADFSTVYAKAMAGDADAMAELPSISTNLLNLGKEQIASRDVYQDLFYDVDRKLKDAQGIAKNQYDTNKLQLDTLQSQLNTQQKSSLTLAEISAKITALSGDLAAAVANAAKTPLTQTESLLQSKADLLNKQAYQGRTDWTAQSTQQAIHNSGMTVDQWWAGYGVSEGVSNSYTSSSSGKSDMALLAAKAAEMNAGRTLASGQSAGGWSAASVAQAIADSGMTVSQWYDRYGKAEGFATGGITPANQPFWVGENGPELVVSPQQWGVINNTDSMALMRGMSGGGNINSGAIVAAINNMNDTLRQLLTKTDRIMADQGRIRDRMDMFAQEGVTIAAA